jgi:AcrR family transcriptional regulator
MSSARRKVPASRSPRREGGKDDVAARGRILEAAFRAFTEGGYAATSTLEIATRARVSKRELYALVGTKHEMLIACIRERSRRLQVPADLPKPRDRETLAHLLVSFGTQLLREISDPTVVAVFRLAIAESVQAPEVARTLDSIGREASRTALRGIMTEGAQCGLLEGEPAVLAEQFGALLWGDLLVSLLLGVAPQPNLGEIAGRVRDAVSAFLQLHPHPALVSTERSPSAR